MNNIVISNQMFFPSTTQTTAEADARWLRRSHRSECRARPKQHRHRQRHPPADHQHQHQIHQDHRAEQQRGLKLRVPRPGHRRQLLAEQHRFDVVQLLHPRVDRVHPAGRADPQLQWHVGVGAHHDRVQPLPSQDLPGCPAARSAASAIPAAPAAGTSPDCRPTPHPRQSPAAAPPVTSRPRRSPEWRSPAQHRAPRYPRDTWTPPATGPRPPRRHRPGSSPARTPATPTPSRCTGTPPNSASRHYRCAPAHATTANPQADRSTAATPPPDQPSRPNPSALPRTPRVCRRWPHPDAGTPRSPQANCPAQTPTPPTPARAAIVQPANRRPHQHPPAAGQHQSPPPPKTASPP